jgi:hypothetical protein
MVLELLIPESLVSELLMLDSKMELTLEEMAAKVRSEKMVQDIDLGSMTPQDVNLISSA